MNKLTDKTEIEENIAQRILFKNEACAVINKLSGEAAQGIKKSGSNTGSFAVSAVNLPKELKKLFNTENVQAVHRVDVPVTGCVLFALNPRALKFLNSAFADKSEKLIDKNYWAIIEKPSFNLPESGKLVHWIEVNSRINKSFAYNDEGQGRKKASLNYRIKGEGDNYLFMEIHLATGRHHQIRCQLAALDLHIKGDVKYGAKRNEKDGGIRLHARSLSFPNPLNKSELISVTAPPPFIDNLWKAFPVSPEHLPM